MCKSVFDMKNNCTFKFKAHYYTFIIWIYLLHAMLLVKSRAHFFLFFVVVVVVVVLHVNTRMQLKLILVLKIPC